jgi:lactoylglutathione lyase
MITDLGHTALRVHDLDRSLAFYAELGINESFRLHRPDGSLMLVYLHLGGDRFLELFPGGAETPVTGGSFMHICLVSDDLRADVAALEAKGIVIDKQPVVALDENWQAWLSDPDGNAIELMQLSESSPQRQVARGETPTPATTAG